MSAAGFLILCAFAPLRESLNALAKAQRRKEGAL